MKGLPRGQKTEQPRAAFEFRFAREEISLDTRRERAFIFDECRDGGIAGVGGGPGRGDIAQGVQEGLAGLLSLARGSFGAGGSGSVRDRTGGGWPIHGKVDPALAGESAASAKTFGTAPRFSHLD